MANKEPALNLTYTALKEKTEEMLRLAMRFQIGDTPNDYDQGLRRGILLLWYNMAIETGGPQLQREADRKLLFLLAGFPEEPGE